MRRTSWWQRSWYAQYLRILCIASLKLYFFGLNTINNAEICCYIIDVQLFKKVEHHLSLNNKHRHKNISLRNKRTLNLIFAANSISGFAQGITMLAIPWYFASIIKNSGLFGTAYSIITVIGIGWILYAGTLIDRYSRKNIFLSLNVVGAIVLGLVSLSGFIFGQVPQALALLAFATTIFIYNLHYPTLYGLGQEITEKENYAKMNSQLEIQGQITSMISGGSAAVLLSGVKAGNTSIFGMPLYIPFSINAWPLHEIILLDACTYVVAFLIISQIQYKPVVERNVDTSHIFQRLRTGVSFLLQQPYLFLFGICSLSIFVVSMVHTYYLLAVYISKHLHAGAYIYAGCELFYAFGAVIAGISIRKIFRNMHAPVAIGSLILLAVTMILTMAFSKSVLIIFLFSVVLGLSNAGSRIMRITYIFHQVDNNRIGRVNSVFSVSHSIMRTLFIFFFSFPFFLRNDNIIYAYAIFGFFAAFAALVLISIRKKLPLA